MSVMYSAPATYPWPAQEHKPRWHDLAKCRDVPLSVFFPERGDRSTAEQAKLVCRDCPVLEECRTAGLAERHGVWGGLSERERRALKSAS